VVVWSLVYRIIVDERERRSGVPEALLHMNVPILVKRITVGDYILSESCAVERKKLRDFLKSIYDGRLFDQAKRLSEAYSVPVMIVEGNIEDLRADEKTYHQVLGALVSLSLKYGVHVFFSKDEEETAYVIFLLLKHLRSVAGAKGVVVHKKPKAYSTRERQLLVLQSLPGVGPKLAERLLKKFKTVRAVFTAPPHELLKVEGMDLKKVQNITKVLDKEYTVVEEVREKQERLFR